MHRTEITSEEIICSNKNLGLMNIARMKKQMSKSMICILQLTINVLHDKEDMPS